MYRVLDLFAGAGGLAEGLRQVVNRDGESAFHSAGAIDLWDAACETFQRNHGITAVCDEVSEASVRKALGGSSKVDLVVGGPPCQGFSTSGKRALEDPRNQLVLRFLETVKLLQPKAFIIENVQGFTTFQEGLLFDEVLEFASRGCGYRCKPGLLLASLYGAPQRRRRFILVGVRTGEYSFPEPTAARRGPKRKAEMLFDVGESREGDGRLAVNQEPDGHREVTFAEATSDLPPVPAGHSATHYASDPANGYQKARRAGANGELTYHEAPRHSDKILQMMRYIKEGQSALDPEVLRTIPPEYQPSSGFPNSYARIRWDRPAPTITRNFTTPSSANCIHPVQDRALTLREGARCQSFDDSYRFSGSFGDKRLLIGNAVPPLLARALGESLLPHLQS